MWEQRWDRWNLCSSNAWNSSIICERALSTALYESCPFSFSPPWAVAASHSLFICSWFVLIFCTSAIEMLCFCTWSQISWNWDNAEWQAIWHSCGRPSFSLHLLLVSVTFLMLISFTVYCYWPSYLYSLQKLRVGCILVWLYSRQLNAMPYLCGIHKPHYYRKRPC